MWIAHLSDSHIRPDGVLYQDVLDTNAALAAAVRHVNTLEPQPDLVLLTGDVVDVGEPAEYAAARSILSALRPRLLVIPGNHDAPGAFRDAFRDHAYLPPDGPLSFVDDTSGPVRVIAFDVTVPGQHHGIVSDSGLSWLETVLAADPDRPTVLMMHQPPIHCGVPYLDKYRCMDGHRLEGLLSRYPAVERVLCGHVHRQMHRRFGGTLLSIAPSTATTIALRPYDGAEPACFIEPAGFLLHQWRDDGLLTHSVTIGSFPGPLPFA
jgi:Icc protein